MPRLTAAEARKLAIRMGRAPTPRRKASRPAPVRLALFDRDLAGGDLLPPVPADMLVARFEVPGSPVPKARPRFDPRSGHIYTPDTTAEYEERVRLRFALARRNTAVLPLAEAVGARLRFHTADEKPDVDNLTKAVLDALNRVVYADDRQVVQQYGDVERGVAAACERVEVVLYRLAWLAAEPSAE